MAAPTISAKNLSIMIVFMVMKAEEFNREPHILYCDTRMFTVMQVGAWIIVGTCRLTITEINFVSLH